MADVAQSPEPLARILSLPPELRLELVKFIKATSDLCNLCLTHPLLHDVAVPRLYETVSLSIEKLTRDLDSSLNLKNQGLKYLRYLEICESGFEVYKQSKHSVHLMRLLSSLPRGSLRIIWIYTPSEVSSAIDAFIFRTQKNLSMLVVHAGGLPKRTPFALPEARSSALTTLTLFIKSDRDLVRHAGILQKLVNLKDLSLIVCSFFMPEDKQQTQVPSPDIVQALVQLASINPSARTKLKLERLYLDGFDFIDCARDLVDSLEVVSLKQLALLSCQGTWSLMEELTKSNVNLRVFIDDRFQDWHPATPSAEAFLRGFKGLKELKRTVLPLDAVDIAECTGVAWSAVREHAGTLEILYLDDAFDGEDAWKTEPNRSIDEFRKLCSCLSSLQQLAVRSPTPFSDSEGFHRDFVGFLECLKTIKNLTSLRLLLKPPSLQQLDINVVDSIPDSVYAKMQQLADIVFSALTECFHHFSALVITASDSSKRNKGYQAVDFGYIRQWKKDGSGMWGITARYVEAEDLKYYEHCSDVFYAYTDDIWHKKHAKVTRE